MNAFNKTVRKSKSKKEFRDASHDAWQMLKNYPGCRFFSGFVSTEDLDKQNDIVEVKKAFERISSHIDRGGTMVDTHTNRTCGAFVHVEMGKTRTGKEGVIAHSVIFQGEPYYDTVWEQIKKGIDCPTCRDVRKGFSIGGFALETRNACDASGCHRDILDMSIHEISICQDPANPEALVQEVNMMAKSENEMSKKDDEISKVLREDAVSTAEPAAPVAAVPQAPAAPSADPAAEAGKAQVPGQDVSQLDAKTVSTWLKNKHKENEEYQKLLIQLNGLTNPANISGVGVAKACNTSGVSLDEDVHTSICDNKCPENKEVEGDVHDPQVKDTMKFFENKKIEAEPAAKKDHGELMPGKDLKEIKFETTKVGPVVETKVMEGYGKLEPKNASSDMFEIPRGHLENDSEEAEEIEENVEDIEEEADDIEEIAEDIIEEDSEELEKAEDKKHSNCDCQTAEKFKSKFKPNGGASETIKDAGSKEEKNFGKEGKKVMMNGMDKAEIPDDLMPLFKEFLQEKGIKMEPEVQNEAIESPIEKAIYVDEDISEIDLKELANRQSFDSATILGKVATQKLRLHNSTTRMRLAKSLKVADIEYLTSSLEKDFAKNIKKKQ